jgi:glycine/D-amino acid oxidase-like deaminating enzyme
MQVSVLGGGLSGTLLAWRLAQQPDIERVSLAPGPARDRDATAASGGAVRGYETEAGQRRLALDSLLELRADARLRDWAGFTLTGAVYRPLDTAQLAEQAAEIEDALPGSVRLLTATELREQGWADLGDPTEAGAGPVAVAEQQAGFLGPERLRGRVLADLAGRRNVELLPDGPVTGLAAGEFDLAGVRHRADVVVLAAGAWTPALLRAAGFDSTGLRSKAIQYTIFEVADWRPGTFVDEVTSLYGKPAGDGQLIGLPTQLWDAPADGGQPDQALSDEVFALAQRRFPRLRLTPGARPVLAPDCYSADSRLELRPVVGTGGRLCTFTGGSGGAAKTALAASARAARQLSADPVGAAR